ncbi:hypothetical protein SAMN04487771_106614, partial [[Clostridium] aminophilum]
TASFTPRRRMLYRLCRVREISPGTHTFFHTYTCPVYCWRSVQFLDFGLFGSLIHASQPVRDSCSSGQRFASGFLQTHTSRWSPCLWLHPSHCRADQGLSPLRTCARRAHQKPQIRLTGRPAVFFRIRSSVRQRTPAPPSPYSSSATSFQISPAPLRTIILVCVKPHAFAASCASGKPPESRSFLCASELMTILPPNS